MATAADQLTSFVRDCLARGVARGDITRKLAAAGWSEREATLALDAFAESSLPMPVPRKRVSSSARDAFLHIVAMVALLAIENYHERRGELPASLDDLRAAPRTSVRDIDDPVTGTPYGYRPTGPRTYELTATFDLESPPREPRYGSVESRDGFFAHGPGPRTFTITVPEKPQP